jgi:type IV pilus assembly protein PilC
MAADPGIFSEVMVNLVRSGEVTGQLAEVLGELVRSLKWQSELAAQTKKILMYPTFVTLTITGVVVFLMVYLVPQLVGFIRNMGDEIPLQTRMLIWLSGAFVEYWWIILPAPVGLFMAVSAAARANPQIRFKLHQATLNMPVVGPVIKKIILARLTDSFALMYRTGIPVIEALSYCGRITTNLPVQQALLRTRERIANGSAISDAFAAESLFPTLVVRMLRVGESTGALDEALVNVSYFFTRDIEESIERVQALIEPVLTVVLGLILGWIMLAVLGPIYDTISRIQA